MPLVTNRNDLKQEWLNARHQLTIAYFNHLPDWEVEEAEQRMLNIQLELQRGGQK